MLATRDTVIARLDRAMQEKSLSLSIRLDELLPQRSHVFVVAGAYRFREGVAVKDRIHHAIKRRRVVLSQITHKYSGFAIGQHDGIPGGIGLCWLPVEAKLTQLSQASFILDGDLLAAQDGGARFGLADQLGAAPHPAPSLRDLP